MPDQPMDSPSEPVEQSLILSMILGWLFPGLGHLYMKKWKRGLICGGSILLLFVIGLVLHRWTYASRADFPFYLSGIYGSGFILVVQPLVTARQAIDLSVQFHFYEIGILFISVAGLLNATTVLNLIDVKHGRSLLRELEQAERDEQEEAGTAAADPAEAPEAEDTAPSSSGEHEPDHA